MDQMFANPVLADVIRGLIGAAAVTGLYALVALLLDRRNTARARRLETLYAQIYAPGRAEELAWEADVRAGAALVDGIDGDKALLLHVLRALKAHLQEAVDLGPQAFGSALLAERAERAWRADVEPVMRRTIEQIDAHWDQMQEQLALAGLTGAPLLFKATAVQGEVEAYRRLKQQVHDITDGDGRDDLARMLRDFLRWSRLSKVLEVGDVVWESAALAATTFARVSTGVMPDPAGDYELARHGVTEFKKIVEMVTKRGKPRKSLSPGGG